MPGMMIQLRGVVDELHTAQSKAPNDVADIAGRFGFKTVRVNPFIASAKFLWMAGRVLSLLMIPIIGLRVPRKSILFVQFPDSYQGKVGLWLLRWIKRHRDVRMLMLVHDLATLRYQDQAELDEKKAIVEESIGMADALIVHNERMKEWLVGQGVPARKMVPLVMFDYLTDFVPQIVRGDIDFRSVAIPGYLALSGSGYLARLKELAGVTWHLYGVGYDADKVGADNVRYHGTIAPECLPHELTAGFGLIWYGDSMSECNGHLGRYSKYINPHKFSLFVATGLPVIVWTKSAMAEFVVANKIGLAIDSLADLPRILTAMSKSEYEGYRTNVLELSKKVREGRFTREALTAAMGILEGDRR